MPKGSLEAWLLLRSLRTLHLRVPRQSETATGLVHWLDKISQIPRGQTWDGVQGGKIIKVFHSSLQAKTANWDISKQMEGGWSPTFSFLVSLSCALVFILLKSAQLSSKEQALVLPHLVKHLVVSFVNILYKLLLMFTLIARHESWGRGEPY